MSESSESVSESSESDEMSESGNLSDVFISVVDCESGFVWDAEEDADRRGSESVSDVASLGAVMPRRSIHACSVSF